MLCLSLGSRVRGNDEGGGNGIDAGTAPAWALTLALSRSAGEGIGCFGRDVPPLSFGHFPRKRGKP